MNNSKVGSTFIAVLLRLMIIPWILQSIRELYRTGYRRNESCQVLKDAESIPGKVYLSLSIFQAIASAGTGIVISAGAIAIVHLSDGNSTWAGIPVALVLGVSAVASIPFAVWKDKCGYGQLLHLASWSGLVGAILCITSLYTGLIACMILGLLGIGTATCAIFMSRFSAIEMTAPQERGKAFSFVMTGATIGAIAAPLIASAMSNLFEKVEGQLSAPFIVAFCCYISGFPLLKFSIPRALLFTPLLQPVTQGGGRQPVGAQQNSTLNISIAMICVIATQASRVLLMAVSPIYMKNLGFSNEVISIILSIFFVGMYGTSYIAGWLSDKVGRRFVISAGACILTGSYLLIAASTQMAVVTASLFLLGLGWNFCFISSNVILTDFTKGLSNPGKLQGLNDVLVNIASGCASIAGGILLSGYQITGIVMIGIGLSIMPLFALLIFKVINSMYANSAELAGGK